ncbi:hypothetical protein [Magnetospirillum sp. UT-4]|uniref:hypothetical protein n=1 Tax=Magnetospirillum sp. UT-4 TaxID=2681467 RepID=UPI00137E676F|nr:hypothetical protein [Magnetospirillum sp. UT-4]CAA7614230.1 conserved exported hypothetical protein [Magnetospirillum sp. UT-4]
MLRPMLVAAILLAAGPVLAQQPPVDLLPARPAVPPVVAEPLPPPPGAPVVEEPAPTFQPIRPAEPEPAPVPVPVPVPVPAVPQVPAPAPEAAAPPPVPAAENPAEGGSAGLGPSLASAALLVLGALLAGLFGLVGGILARRHDFARRRRAVAAALATELETRRLAFEAVPLPPNVEAGVSFVSSVVSLAGIDAGFRSAQGELFLLPGKLSGNVSVHYAAVQRVADVIKSQSFAAGLRMLQANRLGGNPCPDAGTMRDAHVELGAAFRGIDKLIGSLRNLA